MSPKKKNVPGQITRQSASTSDRLTVNAPNQPALDRTLAALESAHRDIKVLQAQVEDQQYQLEQVERYRKMAVEAVNALDSHRNRRILRLLERVFDRSDVYDQIAPPFQRIKDDTVLFNGSLKGYYLQASPSLHRQPFIAYHMQFDPRTLKSIMLLPILDIPLSTGYIGLEILDHAGEIVAQPTLFAEKIYGGVLEFNFEPGLALKNGDIEIRVYARGVDVPLRIYEWRKYTFFGLGPIRRKAFMGFEFME